MPLVTLRGRGPAPTGYLTCTKGPACPAYRDPCTGRYGSPHYHPVPTTPDHTLATAALAEALTTFLNGAPGALEV